MKKHTAISYVLAFFIGLGSVSAQQQDKPYKAYIVSNAHFDSQWNWDVQTSINEYIPNTLNQNLFLLEKYPNYIFNFEGGIKYSWMKEYFPHQYELIKKYIKNGRWHISGSSWDANDVNVPSPESFSRNILYGQQFYENEFGVRSTDIFLPDCFGFGWTLPTIAAHAGLIGFSTQKLEWRNNPFYGDRKIPFEIGLWKGVDGSQIMMIAHGYDYVTKWKDEDLSKNGRLQELAKNSPLKTVYHYYGTGDRGGSPTIESMRAMEKGVQGAGPVRIVSAASDQIYKDYLPFGKYPELPVFEGELLMDVHGTGCYTSQAAMKLYNRKNEIMADAAERAAVAADWLGAARYPQATLSEAWKRFIWHQFHDDLTGTSIPRAYEFSWNDELLSLKQFADVLGTSAGGVARALDTRVKGTPIVIYNPVSQPVSDVVEIEVNLSAKNRSVSVYDENGKTVPCQVVASENGKMQLLVAASVPANGYVVYDLRTSGKPTPSALAVSGNTLENSLYKITLNQNGDIASLFDKKNQRELVESGKAIRLAMFTDNPSHSWPAWEILKKTVDKTPESVTGDVKISIAEKGPLRAALCVEKHFKGSVFKQYIRLSEGGQKERIDLYNEIDWQTENALLKAEFPLTVSNPLATYDLGIGAIKRGNNMPTAYEVCAQRWADLSAQDQGYGVSILNDCKYGWDKPNDNTLRLTLLHTPGVGGNFSYQGRQDFGHHVFTYSVYPHAGTYQKAGTVLKAEILGQPLRAFVTGKHAGTLGKSFSFVTSDNSNVLVKALKKAEKSDEYVIRLYETAGTGKQEVTLDFPSTVLSAKELNGVEDEMGSLPASGHNVSFTMHPFGMKTIRVKLQAPEKALNPTSSVPLALDYNLKTSTFNTFRGETNFDGRGRSFAAELLPEEIEYKGIRFKLGEPDAANGMRCNGTTVTLPQGRYNKISFLAASSRKNVKARFVIDGKAQEAIIPAYDGFIGQWGHDGHTKGFLNSADVAYIGTHCHTSAGNKDLAYDYTYMYCISFNLPENAREIVLPGDSRIVLFAATVSQDDNNLTTPAGCPLNLGLPDIDNVDTPVASLLRGKKVIDYSGQVNDRENAAFAIDENLTTKWCDVSDKQPKYVAVDLGKTETLNGWKVAHAGAEEASYITKEYSLQVKSAENEEWKTIDTVSGNMEDETDRRLTPSVKARFVRLHISQPDQSGGNTCRIYEFSVY